MYTVSENGSARFTKAQSTELTDIFKQVGEKTGIPINSFREGMLALIEYFKLPQEMNADEFKNSESEYKKYSIVFTPEAFENLKEAFLNTNEENETDFEDSEITLESLEKITKTIWPPKSIEDQLSKGQVLFEMDEEQYAVFKLIQDNRAKLLEKQGGQRESDAELCKAILFNESVLYNWGGGIYTGLS